MGTNKEDLSQEVKIENTEPPATLELTPEMEHFKDYMMSTIGKMIDDKIKVATTQIWQRLQEVEAKAEINTDTDVKTRGIIRNHVHIN